MNKTLIGVIVALLVLGGVIYVLTADRNKSADTTQSTSQVQTASESGGNKMDEAQSPRSIKDLFGSKSSQKCTFKDANNSVTVYVSSGNTRSDFTSTEGNKTVTGHMILTGETYAMWTDGNNQGFKMPVSTALSGTANTPGTEGSLDVNQKVDYACSGWSADNDMFVLPSNINFMDLGSMKIPGQ
jgi:hypothetical protein